MTALSDRSIGTSHQSAALSPLAYGYMRVPSDLPDAKVRRMEHELRRFAERRGWCLATIFSEFTCGQHDAFHELIQELRRAEAHYVVVPTFRHLARNRLLQNSLLARLEFDAEAEVFELVETT
jgi:DNA invertase Pin-like site-specific DNA recombinase